MRQVKPPTPSVRKKQVRQVSPTKGRLRRFILGVLGVSVVLGGGFFLVKSSFLEAKTQSFMLSLSRSLGLSLEDVAVAGRERTAPETLLSTMGIQRGDSLLALDPVLLRDKIKKLPWIYEASVRRQFPDTLMVDIQERQPLALWQNESKHHLIDQYGQVIPLEDVKPYKDLLVVSGTDAPQHAPELIEFLSKYPGLQSSIHGGQYMRANRWDLYLDHNICVKLPEHDVDKAMVRLGALHEEGQLNSDEILVVDLRDPDRLTIRMTPEAAKKYYKKGQDV